MLHRKPRVGGVALVLVMCASPPAWAQGTGAPAAPPTFHLLDATIDDVRTALQLRRLTCHDLAVLHLNRIEAFDYAGPSLNSVQTVNPNLLRDADRLDAAFESSGPVGPLHCIPVLVKDQIETSDMPTTYGSAVFAGFQPPRDATVVTRLRSAGALIVGKATMGEFASGYFGSMAGVIRNAYDPLRNASGSSGGTGSGVTANFAVVGVGEDTGGSVRGPASVSSLVGLRPTLQLVSRHGMLPSSPSADTLGPIARTVKDAAILLDTMAGYDPKDPITAYAVGQVPASYTAFLDKDGLRGARIGVIRTPMDATTDTRSEDYRQVRAVIDRALADMQRLGAQVIENVTIPDLEDRLTKGYSSGTFETEAAVDAYLAQLPGAPVRTLRDIVLSGKVVPSRARSLMSSLGRSSASPGYLEALLSREGTRQTILALMADERLDALVYATFHHQPARIAPDVMTKSVVADAAGLGNNRRLSPVVGFPALTVPAGFTAEGIPVGIEFLARPFAEGLLFKLGYAFEQGTHHRKPPSSTPALQGEP